MKKEKSRSAAALGPKLPADKPLTKNKVETPPPWRVDDTQRLLHELEDHKKRLETQNAELLKTREELQTSLAKYADLYDFSPVANFTLASNGVILGVNLTGASLLGTGRSRLIGRYFQLFVPVKERPAFIAFLNRVLSSEARESYEITLNKEETPAYFVRIEAIAGQFSRNCRLAVIDITEKKQEEEALLKSEAKYRTLFENNLDAIFLTNPSGMTRAANQAACEMFGMTEEELIKAGHTGIIDHADKRLAAALDERARTGRFFGEFSYIRKDGTKFIAETSSVILDGGSSSFVILHNISERKRAEQQLLDSEAHYRRLFEVETDAIFLVDMETMCLLDANLAAQKMYGYILEEFLRLKVEEISAEPEKTRQAIASNCLMTPYCLHRKKDGTVFPVEISGSFFEYNGREVYVAAMRDITVRDRIERIMQARLRLLQFAHSHSLGELFEATLDELEKLTGSAIGFYVFVESDQKTLSFQAWSTRTHKEFCSAEAVGKRCDISEGGVWLDALYERRPVIHNDYSTLPHRNGLPVVRDLVVPVFWGDRIVAIFGVGNKQDDYNKQDLDTVTLLADMAWGIVKCKLAEKESLAAKENCERFFNLIPELACIVSTDGFFRKTNPAWEASLGYKCEELQTSPFLNFIHPDDVEATTNAIERLINGCSSFNIKNRYRRKDGTYRWLEWVALPAKDTGLIYAAARDITDMIRLEEEAKLNQAKLIQTNKMSSLGLIASGIAHEINNPNNFILSNATLLAEAWRSAMPILEEYYRENGDFSLGDIQYSTIRDNAPRFFSGLVEGAKRIRGIVERIKYFARQDTGNTDEAFDVGKMILDAMAILDHEIKKYCDSFRIEAASGLPQALGNAQQLGQVMINLLVNALQALPDRKRGIRIKTGLAEDGEHIFIKVEDEGVGIPAEALEQICDPFFTTKRTTGGTGLGLSISTSILKENRGTLSFASESGGGTTATVLLRRLK